jgi:hypothetical protein
LKRNHPPTELYCVTEHNMRYMLKPLNDDPAVESESQKNHRLLWLDDLNWFLALAEFQRRTQHQKCFYFLLEVWCDQQRVLALPINCNTDGRYWSTLTNFYTPNTDFMQTSDIPPRSDWHLLLNALSALYPGWVRLVISPLQTLQCQDIISCNGPWYVNKFFFSTNWQASTASVEAYWQQRPSQLKNTVKRKKNKLLKNDCRIEIHHTLTSELLEHYWRVYHQSWKQPEADQFFINWLAWYSASAGLLRLGMVYCKDKPIACQLWLVQNQSAAIYKLAQDQAFDALSPGTVLMAEMAEYVISQDKAQKIDFLTGNDNYKALWMDQMTPIYGVELFNLKYWSGRLLCWRHKLKKTVKYFFTSVRSRLKKRI